MLGNSGGIESSGHPPLPAGSGEGGSNLGGEDYKDVRMEGIGGDRTAAGGGSGGGNRWPRPETLALLKIRSEMDSVFRDSTLKAPLWEEVSRKMWELGYKRSAKKCKEKFENVYKYHKRTKEGRPGKSEGKTYRFFDQLEALQNLHSDQSQPKSQAPKIQTTATATVTALLPWISTNNPSIDTNSSSLKHHVSVAPATTNPSALCAKQLPFALPFVTNSSTFNAGYNPSSNNFTGNVSSLNLFSSSTSSSTASDDEREGKKSRKKRRYWKGLFKKLTKELMEKQEEMQKKFMETLEKREKERIAREEAWRVQEASRINREHEILVHERSMAAAKDAAVISFLQKVSGQQPQQQQQQQQKQLEEQQQQQKQHHRSGDTISFQPNQEQAKSIVESTTTKVGNVGSNYLVAPSSSRWPKSEVEALIRLRTNLDSNSQENGTKGPLWEEISGGMRGLGYNRSAKRCKEKWENINKYFKKVKESNKKRTEDSKTCPYFHQLEAIYKERNKIGPTTTLPLMVAPEQQLPLPQETRNQITERQKAETEGDRVRDDDGMESDEEDQVDDREEEKERCEFEMVLNKTCSSMDIKDNIVA